MVDPDAPTDARSLSIIRGLVWRVSRGDADAIDELIALSASDEVTREAAEVAEDMGLILVKLEAREFLLDDAHEAESRLRELNELKNRHLGIAAHDLRNPIGAIRGMARLIATGRLSEARAATFIQSIIRVSDEMAKLVDSLLDVAVIESGRFDLNVEVGNLGRLCHERLGIAASIAERKGIRLESSVSAVPDSEFDASRMNQVVDNLLSNAIKFSPPEATVKLECTSQGEDVVIVVRDQGPGIPPDEIDRIFETYEKSSARPTGGEKSTGLGLFILKAVVDAHGGEVDVDSTLGSGTAFTVRIPVA